MWRCLPLYIGDVDEDKTPYFPAIYIVSSCPRGHGSSKDCSTSDLAADSRNYLHDVPLMDATSGVWYRNIYCAVCHAASENLAPVNMSLKCSNNTIWNEVSEIASYQGQLTWTWNDTINNGSCYLEVTPAFWPRTRRGLVVQSPTIPGFYRPCVPTVDSCPAPWSDEETRKKCHSYAYFVTTRIKERNITIFKNAHCAICNDHSSFVCFHRRTIPLSRRTNGWRPPSLSMVMNFEWGFEGEDEWRKKRIKCSPPYGLYDAINKRCQHLKDVCELGYHYENQKCLSNDGNQIELCPKSYLSAKQFKIMNNGSLLKFGDEFFPEVIIIRDYYKILENGVAEICLISDDKQNYASIKIVTISDLCEGIISCVCFAASIICLVLHISAYITVPKLRNLPGKNLFALSWSLLLAQLLFLFGSHPIVDLPPNLCVAIATLTHFFFLASFFWMNVMSFDIWRKFSSHGMHGTSPMSLHRKYAVYAWITPGIIVGVSILVDRLHLLSEYARPNYGREGICWIGSPLGLGIFFATPMICIVISNIFLFTTTVIKIKRQIKESASYIKKRNRDERIQCKRRSHGLDGTNCSEKESSLPDKGSGIAGKRDQIRTYLYIKLFMIMGLTWIFGIVNGFVKVEILWYPFIILNGLQGAFIFFMFDCKKTIGMMVWERTLGEKYEVPEFLKPSKGSAERSTKTDSVSSTTRLRRISGLRNSTTVTGLSSTAISAAPEPNDQHEGMTSSDHLVRKLVTQ